MLTMMGVPRYRRRNKKDEVQDAAAGSFEAAGPAKDPS